MRPACEPRQTGEPSGQPGPPVDGLTKHDERARIAGYYQHRADTKLQRRYSPFKPGHLFLQQRLERDLLAALARHGYTDLRRRSILDVGCGDGSFLRRCLTYGAERHRLAGVDLLPERIAAGRRTDPALDLRFGDASALPFADGTFDLVFQFTVLSSVLDDRMRVAVTREMARVLAPDGAVVSYDFLFARDPRNTRPLTRRELRELFPGFVMDARRVTLFPPLSRALAEWSWIACELLEMIPFLRGHDLVVLRKPSVARGRGEPSPPSPPAGRSRDR